MILAAALLLLVFIIAWIIKHNRGGIFAVFMNRSLFMNKTEHRLDAQNEQRRPACKEIRRGACHQLVGSYFKVCNIGVRNLCCLQLQKHKKDRCGSAKKRARKTRRLEAPTAGGQPQTTSGEPQKLQVPSTSAAKGEGAPSAQPESLEGEVPTHAQKRQRSADGTLEGGQTNWPKQTGQLRYARAAKEGVRVVVVNEDYRGTQPSRDAFVNIKKEIGRFVDELP
jgi:hypothetical protein